MTQSKALEVNLETSRYDVVIDPKYKVLNDITADYVGLRDTLDTLLKELCHPLKNWQFIINETRRFALHNFHLFIGSGNGPNGANLIADIFLTGASEAKRDSLRADAVDNLLAYLIHIINEAGKKLIDYEDTLNRAFNKLLEFDDDDFFFVVRSFYDSTKIARALLNADAVGINYAPAANLMRRCLDYAYRLWLKQPDPKTWFLGELDNVPGDGAVMADLDAIFKTVSHDALRANLSMLPEKAGERVTSLSIIEKLSQAPSFRRIADEYDRIPRLLMKAGGVLNQGEQWNLLFLLHIMSLNGLASIHERTLREINKSLARLIRAESRRNVQNLIKRTFRILKDSSERFPATTLSLILNMGQAVYQTDENETIDYFINSVMDIRFQTPDIHGVGDDWEIKVNASHVQNIRTWMELIEIKPLWSKKLVSALIVQLSLFGVFIKDTDLFPRDITRLLNADIGPVYNLVKQLCRLFPTYFNEIGAEGKLRDVSTRLDDCVLRKDILVHFLRKQAHVESSPQTVRFTEAVFRFWLTRDKTPLKEFTPSHIFAEIQTDGVYVDGVNLLMSELTDKFGVTLDRFLEVSEEDFKEFVSKLESVCGDTDRERLNLAHSLYLMLYQKYSTDMLGLDSYITGVAPYFSLDVAPVREALSMDDKRGKLIRLLDFLEKLQATILSDEQFEVHEDIYYKRHIAVDIPSMYGSYHEARFDALGLTFRLESLVNTLFQELIDDFDFKLLTRAAFIKIHDYLCLFNRALRLDGVRSRELEHQMDLLAHSLDIRGFSFTQFLDIFRGLSNAVRNLVNDYFNNIYHAQIAAILNRSSLPKLLKKYLPPDGELDEKKLEDRVSEMFMRDRIAASLGLQQLDQFVTRTLKKIFQQDHKLSRERLRRLLNYDPNKAATVLDPVKKDIADLIHLGSKGYNLVRLTEHGLPVPPGFIITTEVFRCRGIIDDYEPARDHFFDLLRLYISGLERRTERRFGSTENPLLLSVRSGSSISQPGMLSTFLDVGINEGVVEGMIARAGDGEWFAWDCYRRYLQSIGMAQGLTRDEFDNLMVEAKEKYGIPLKRQFSGPQMKEMALTYKEFALSCGVRIEEDPFMQLYQAVMGVFDSWTSERAEAYRHIMNISDDWGTAVTVQAMVFGNMTDNAGSGVFFTHNPRWSGDNLMLWGDFAICNQGEDIVSGLVKTFPVSLEQAEIESRSQDFTLETRFPYVYRRIKRTAVKMIHEWGYSPQEMEFTFEGPQDENLFFLQNRDMALREFRTPAGLDLSAADADDYLGRGVGVSGGGMSGRIVFSISEINEWRRKDPAANLILVRGDTVPDDIREIHESDGLLTARGGSTSHAAIVAYRLKKTCVVGCAEMVVQEKSKTCSLENTTLQSGDWISIDGLGGSIYKGRLNVKNDLR